jgi:hypothetical protein
VTCSLFSTQQHVPTTPTRCDMGKNADAIFSLTMSSLIIQRGWKVDG